MAENGDPTFMEGFICPMCKSDFESDVKLLSHFQETHSEEQVLIKTFKEMLGMAKKKILKQDTAAETKKSSRIPSYHSFSYEPQEMGRIKSHMSLFNSIRQERIQRLSVPLNQVIIRLEKLLENIPSDPLKKKAHEQSIVPWMDGTTVKRCPDCAGLFYLARRKHHCRTCGSIMCSECSHFMTIHTARKVLEKPALDEGDQSGDSQFRVCVHCMKLLERRELQRECRNYKPIISQYYEKLSDYRRHADSHYEDYVKMCTSLRAGESTFTLQDGQKKKVEVLRLAESIDFISGKLAVLGKESDTPPQGPALRLQNSIRSAATAYLRNQLLDIPVLPTDDEYEAAQARRRRKITADIVEEKRRHARLHNNVNQQRSSPSQPRVTQPEQHVSMGQGWVPETMKVTEADDPLIEQMNIIRNYIREAKAAGKMDEVTSLERNLQDLRKEFWRREQDQENTYRSGESSEAGSVKSYDGRTLSEVNSNDFH